MALTVPNFTATQSLANLSYITLADTSTGTDGTLTTRRVYFEKADGTYLTTDGNSNDYETWDYADSSKTFDILPRDMALKITVQWYAGASLLYSKEINYGFTLYDYDFLYSLTSRQTSDPSLLNDTSYYSNKIQMIVNLADAENAIEIGDDIFAAQEAFDRNYVFIQNENYYF